MVIDDPLSDDEGSLISEPPEPIDSKDDAESLSDRIDQLLDNADLEDVIKVFDSLPDPNIRGVAEEEESGSERPFPEPRSSLRRTLVDDDEDLRITDWDDSAGQILRHEPTVHNHWQSLFGVDDTSDQSYRPFSSRLDWEIAQWAVKEKISQKSLNRLLKVPMVKERLGLSFHNARSMLKLVDEIPATRGQWFTKRLSFKDRPDEHFIVRHRNPIEAIRALWGDPALAKDLVYKPAKMFRNKHKPTDNERIFSEMWTGGLWRAAQKAVPRGGTIAPVIIASDKTQLTQFSGNKTAYP
ncbi:hypothetical protein F5880DRAFT_1619629, partial [Lentinula raphanica]